MILSRQMPLQPIFLKDSSDSNINSLKHPIEPESNFAPITNIVAKEAAEDRMLEVKENDKSLTLIEDAISQSKQKTTATITSITTAQYEAKPGTPIPEEPVETDNLQDFDNSTFKTYNVKQDNSNDPTINYSELITPTLNNKLTVSFKEIAASHGEIVPNEVDQISMAVKMATETNQSEIHLSLYPQNLGAIDVKIEFQQGNINIIKFYVEKSETLELLLSDYQQLDRSIKEVAKTDNAIMQFNLKDENKSGNNYTSQEEILYPGKEENNETVVTKSYQIQVTSSIVKEGVDIKV